MSQDSLGSHWSGRHLGEGALVGELCRESHRAAELNGWKGRSGMCSEGRCCLPPLFPREWVSLCWTSSPEEEFRGLESPGAPRSQVSQEPHLELLELASAGRQEPGLLRPRKPWVEAVKAALSAWNC